jgi:LDH2 family malate/lactate/ureidoglycolate dehydrogenase
MTGKPRSHHEIAIASIHVFADDGRLDLAELEKLLALALRDGIVDEDEKRVLANILTRAERDGVDESVLTRIDQVRQQYGLDD